MFFSSRRTTFIGIASVIMTVVMTLLFSAGHADAAPMYGEKICISEIMLRNSAAYLAPDFRDWAELENRSEKEISLDGWILSDGSKKKELVLSGSLGPGEFLAVELGGNFFSLSGGETLTLYDPQRNVADRVRCPAAESNHSLQRLPDGTFSETAWISPGYPNGAEGYEEYESERGNPSSPCIWEVMVSDREHPLADGSLCDWIELKNNADLPVSLSGWALTDDLEDRSPRMLPDVELQPGDFLLVRCDEDEPESGDNTGFSLNAVSEKLYLTDAHGNLADWVYLHDIPIEGSMGRSAEGAGFYYYRNPSPGEENGSGVRRVSGTPEAVPGAGIYESEDGLRIELNAAGDIYYTTDGSLPTEESARYTEPIAIDRTTVIRALVREDGALPGRTATFSYILNEGHRLPVLSLCTDDPVAFRIMHDMRRKDDPQPANLSFYDADGEIFSRDCEVELKGKTSLALPKKSMGVNFSGRYGGNLECDLFGNGITEFDSLDIRGGQDYQYTVFRNELCQDLCLEASSHVYAQASRCCVLYLNGEYRGIYFLKENLSRSFYAQHANVSKGSVDLCQAPVPMGIPLYDLIREAWTGDLSTEENYQKACDILDIDSLIDWFLLECYCANTDTQGNMRMYRSDENGGRWQLCFYDLDWAFGWDRGSFFGFMGGTNNSGADIPPIIRSLSGNPHFRDRVLRRYAELGQGVLSNEHVVDMIDGYARQLAPEMPRECETWHTSLPGWGMLVDDLKDYITEKDWFNYTADQLLYVFKASDEEAVEYFGRVPEHRRFDGT